MNFLSRNGKQIEQVSGRQSEIPGFGKFFIDHRRAWDFVNKERLPGYAGYAITEPRTGLRVGDGGFTVRDAWESAVWELENKGWAGFNLYVKAAIERNGGELNLVRQEVGDERNKSETN